MKLSGSGVFGIHAFDTIPDAIGVRYSMRIEEAEGPGLKLMFGNHRVFNPIDQRETYAMEGNVYNNWREWRGDIGCAGWPPRGLPHYSEGGLWLSIADYNLRGHIGVRSGRPGMAPLQNSGVDGIEHKQGIPLTKIESMIQRDMRGVDIELEWRRRSARTIVEPISGWGHRFEKSGEKVRCQPLLPPDTYQEWRASIGWGRRFTPRLLRGHVELAYLVPELHGRYLHPMETCTFVSEFWNQPGYIRVVAWGFEVMSESTRRWQPLKKWRFFYDAVEAPASAPRANVGYGCRTIGWRSGRALEFSNEGAFSDTPGSYFQFGDEWEL